MNIRVTVAGALILAFSVVACTEQAGSNQRGADVAKGATHAQVADANHPDLSGEYVLEGRSSRLLERFPGRTEYERVVIQDGPGHQGIDYYGVEFEPDHDFVGFFAVKADDVKIEGSTISFSIGDRDLFFAEDAPNSPAQARVLREKGIRRGMTSDRIWMKGVSTPTGIRLQCKSDSEGACNSAVLEFRRTDSTDAKSKPPALNSSLQQ